MFLNQLNRLRRSLAFRLTLWYAGIFSISTFLAFFFFYSLMIDILRSQVDEELNRQLRSFTGIMQVDGLEGVRRIALQETEVGGESARLIRLLSRFGTEFSVSDQAYWRDIGVDSEAIRQLLTDGQPVFETIGIPARGDSLRIIYGIIGPGVIMQLGQSLALQTRLVQAFQRLFAITMALVIALAALIGWFLARRALSGVGGIAHTARRITSGDLTIRAPVHRRGDEIDQLAGNINQMLDRILDLITGIREMSDNIAHDLKSPITRIRGLAEVTLTTADHLDEYQHMASSTIEECDRLLDMINTMLVISRAEAGVEQLDWQPIDLAGLVRDAGGLFETTARDKHLQLSVAAGEPQRIIGDARMLQRMVANLLDNAIRYTPSGGRIHIAVEEEPAGDVAIIFQDSGVGIRTDDLARIFERFYRCDPSRSQTGTGLGLSLAQAVAHAHGGEIAVSSTLQKGSTFRVTLPRNADKAPQGSAD
ncbi:MAG: ATP-binding protein [Desulfobacterales bacterium]|jgi:heavy metal sensor kinase